jgi:hypothetical protein
MDEGAWMKKNNMDEKPTKVRVTGPHQGINRVLNFFKTNTLPIGYLHDM